MTTHSSVELPHKHSISTASAQRCQRSVALRHTTTVEEDLLGMIIPKFLYGFKTKRQGDLLD